MQPSKIDDHVCELFNHNKEVLQIVPQFRIILFNISLIRLVNEPNFRHYNPHWPFKYIEMHVHSFFLMHSCTLNRNRLLNSTMINMQKALFQCQISILGPQSSRIQSQQPTANVSYVIVIHIQLNMC